MNSRSLGHRAPLLWLTLPLLAGLAAGRAGFPAPVGWLLGGAQLFAVAALVCCARRHRGWGLLLAIAMGLAGDASQALHQRRLPNRESLPPREAQLTLRLERVFASRWPDRLSGLAVVADAPPHLRDLVRQRVYVSLALPANSPAPLRSAVISAVGVLALLPRDPPADTFDGFLANSGVNFRLNRGRLLSVVTPPSAYRRFCAAAMARFERILTIGLGPGRPDLAAAYRAMVLGQQQELSEEQVNEFRLTGTMHIFSISGMHIAVIAEALQALLSLARLREWARLPLGLATLWLYVDITGTAPSAVRAFVMVAMLQAARALRRPLNPVAALSASTFLVLLVAPLQVFSASFQMSYGIVASLLLLGLPLAESWQTRWSPFRDLPEVTWRWWHRWTTWIWTVTSQALALGLSSGLVGTVTGLQFFRLVTPGALLVNLALIPASSLVILAGFLSLLCGLAGITAWSGLFNHSAVVVLWASDGFLRLFLRFPAMWFPGHWVRPGVGDAVFAMLLALLLAGYALGWPRRTGGFWPPFVFVALALWLGVKFS